jgi:hypothetical protein
LHLLLQIRLFFCQGHEFFLSLILPLLGQSPNSQVVAERDRPHLPLRGFLP